MLSQAKPGATLHRLLSTRLSTVCRGSKAWNRLSCLDHRGFFNCLQMEINWSTPRAISKVRATGTQRGFFKYYAQISQLSCILTSPTLPPPCYAQLLLKRSCGPNIPDILGRSFVFISLRHAPASKCRQEFFDMGTALFDCPLTCTTLSIVADTRNNVEVWVSGNSSL